VSNIDTEPPGLGNADHEPLQYLNAFAYHCYGRSDGRGAVHQRERVGVGKAESDKEIPPSPQVLNRVVSKWAGPLLAHMDGELTSFENISTYVTPELAYIVEVERFSVKLSGSEQVVPVALRTTSIFRPEDGGWRIVHRHADPITSARPPESVIKK